MSLGNGSTPGTLDAAAIRAALRPLKIGREVLVVEETASTNDLIAERASATAAEGLVIFAENQTAGRGQHGNRWDSAPRKGLWFSTLLRPQIELSESARLTDWLAARVAAVIEAQLQIPAAVKRPNDVYIGARKVAGVLVEMRAMPGSRHIAVAGIGINVNQREDDFPADLRSRAGSLAMFTGAPVDRQRFAIALLRDLDQTYGEFFG